MASSIQFLRSSSPEERPFPGNLLDGQPAINTNPTEPGLFFKASDGSLVKIGPAAITSDGNPPNSAATGSTGNCAGELWLDASVNPAVLKVFDGGTWISAAGGGGSIGVKGEKGDKGDKGIDGTVGAKGDTGFGERVIRVIRDKKVNLVVRLEIKATKEIRATLELKD